MNEMFYYIFKGLRSSEYAVKSIGLILRSQEKFNRAVSIFAVAAAINIVVSENKLNSLKRKVEKMAKEIEELKYVKGD